MTVTVLPSVAQAQGVFDMGGLTNTLSQGALVQSERERARGQGTRGTAVRKANPKVLLYRPNLTVRARNLKRIVEKTRSTDPAAAAEMEKSFAKTDFLGELGRLMRPIGLNPNNVADATALYLVTAWYGTRGSTDGKPANYKAVSAQIARIMASNPTLVRASDATKQQTAESMMLFAVFTEQSVNQAKKRPGTLPQVRAAIAQGAKATFGFDLTKMRLGAKGFY
jgi:hypothetical protein